MPRHQFAYCAAIHTSRTNLSRKTQNKHRRHTTTHLHIYNTARPTNKNRSRSIIPLPAKQQKSSPTFTVSMPSITYSTLDRRYGWPKTASHTKRVTDRKADYHAHTQADTCTSFLGPPLSLPQLFPHIQRKSGFRVSRGRLRFILAPPKN